ncbi:MAG: FtsX-like permease family protein [bacterium]|nr:FtsX-like permease family protein [bacterium]
MVIFLTGFAMMALLLSAIGLYGVISYSVSQRTHEVGVRMAMGARRSTILKMILGQGALLTIFGLVLGAVGAGFLVTYLTTLPLEIGHTEPLLYGTIALFLLAVTLLACAIPAWHATRVSPVNALRVE